MSSSSDRVLRTRKPGRTALDLLNPPKAATTAKPRIRKKSKRVRTQEIETAAHWHPIRLPQELLAHILRFVDSRSTLVVASRVCRSLQDEAERVLYREVTLHRLPQLRSLLQRALKRVRPRAQFIQRLNIDDHGGLAGRAADIKEVLRMLTNLRHLTLHLGALWTKANQYRNVLRILSRCAFSLESFEGDYCPGDNIIAFFRRHQDIVALKIDTPEYVDEHGRADFEFEPHLDDFEVPSTVLPRLRRLYTSPYLARSAFCAPRAVTHLDLGSKPVGEDELHEVLSTFRDLLVKLKYARSPPYIGEAVRSPLRALHLISMPNLEHLDVDDEWHYHSGARHPDWDNVPNPKVKLNTLVWRMHWVRCSRYEQRAFLDENVSRAEHIRRYAGPLLKAHPTLRMFYTGEFPHEPSCTMLFTLSESEGTLVEAKEVTELPSWWDP